jgi:hypothetical protein
MQNISVIKSNKHSVEKIKETILYRCQDYKIEETCIAMRELMDELGHGPETELEAVLDAMTPERREGMLTVIRKALLKRWKEVGFK